MPYRKEHPSGRKGKRVHRANNLAASFVKSPAFIWSATSFTLLMIIAVFMLEKPLTSSLENHPVDGSWQYVEEVFDVGTDRYIPIREEEMRATWDPKLGLEIDAWDPRTHDPRMDPNKVGTAVLPKPQQEKYFLSAVVFNRVFKEDSFNITIYEIRQWLEYMKYAGVEHVYWYDTAHSVQELQEKNLLPYIRKGFLTYHKFHFLFPGNLNAGYNFEQDQSEIHCLEYYGASTKWLAVVDIDEYIFMPQDLTPGFLERKLRLYGQDFPVVSQILLQCMMFVGHPQKPFPSLLVEKYNIRRIETEGVSLLSISRMKAIIQPKKVKRVYKKNPHSFEMEEGKTVALQAGTIRLNHYHGPRDKSAKTVVKDDSIQPIAEELRKVLRVRKRRLSFGP